jgi:hypothetical protein
LQDAAAAHYDVVVLGGTLGILLATALLAQHQQQAGPGALPLRVAVVERGKLQGRQQEWNVSHDDLQVSHCCCCEALQVPSSTLSELVVCAHDHRPLMLQDTAAAFVGCGARKLRLVSRYSATCFGSEC